MKHLLKFETVSTFDRLQLKCGFVSIREADSVWNIYQDRTR